MERSRKPHPFRAIVNTSVVLLMGAAIGYSVYPLLHAIPTPVSGENGMSTESAEAPAPLKGVEPLDAVIWPGRHLFMGIDGTELTAPARQLLAHVKPGAVVLRGANFRDRAQVVKLIADIKKSAGLGTGVTSLPLIAVDLRDAGFQALGLEAAPGLATLASIGNEDTARTLGRKFANDLSELGFSLVFSPILDVFDPDAFEEDAASYDQAHFNATKMALGFLAGAKEGGVIPIAQGFPGRASAHPAPGLPVPVLDQDRYVLAKIMYSFIEAMSREDKIPAILVEHVAVPSLDDKFPGRSAALSPVLVQTVLRKTCEYDGVILSGDVSGDPAVASDPTERVAVQALAAGCDAVVLLEPDPKVLLAVCKAIETAVFLDTLSGDQLDNSKARLDTLQNLLSAVEPPAGGDGAATIAATPPPPGDTPAEDLATPPTVAISREEAPVDVPEETVPPAEPLDAPADAVEVPDVSTEELAPPVATTRPVEHTVAEHESLTEIANQYGVTVKNLLTWNGLLDPQVQPGQVLRVAAPEEVATEPADVTPDASAPPAADTVAGGVAPSDAVAEPATPATAEEPAPAAPEVPAPANDESVTTHTVVAGDTLYRIAMQYSTTPERIIELNNIKNSNVVVLGAKLKVPKQ